MDNRGDNNALLSVLAGVGLGAIVGAAVALLFTPKTGEEVRNEVQHGLDDLKDRAERVAGDLVSRAEELTARSKAAMGDASQRVREAVVAGKEAATEAGKDVQARVDDAKDQAADAAEAARDAAQKNNPNV